VVVIDDFHYMPQHVQLGIVRGLKDLVFQGLGVVLAAVPHRAYDAVRVEKEMTGRVVQLPIDFWSEEERASPRGAPHSNSPARRGRWRTGTSRPHGPSRSRAGTG